MVAARGLSHFKDARRKPGFKPFIAMNAALEKPALSFLRMVLPTDFGGSDISGWLPVAIVYFKTRAGGGDGAFAPRRAYVVVD